MGKNIYGPEPGADTPGQGAHEDQQGTNGNGLQDPNDGEFLGQTVAAWGQIMGEMGWEMGKIWWNPDLKNRG